MAAQVLCGRAGRLEPRLKTVVAESRHQHGNEPPARRRKIDRRGRAGRLDAYSRERFVARPIVGQLGLARLKDRAEDFAKPGPLVLNARLCGRHEDKRWRIDRIGIQRWVRTACDPTNHEQ